MKNKKRNYINNKDLFEAMKNYKKIVDENKIKNIEPPVIPDYIGKSIMLICSNLAKKPNFSGYTYKQDMISDGIIDCVAAVNNFNPERTNNPFAYFTQIAWNAFIRRINKEKKQTYIKHKNYQNSSLLVEMETEVNMNSSYKSNDFSDDIIKSFEDKLTKSKKEVKLSGVEIFSTND